ncbi:unnamed protein product [Adineta ricciae]|uniref:G-protein coupled receptors family 1 profile domain-containing protein n=1 Tax=Adineta ricciae TaxID=249248 RepID=A0A814Y298_ADIRI|nr:unnamed protein product [Adineta ricciae]
MNNTTVAIVTPFPFTTSFQANRIKFGVLLVLQILSIPCFLYVFTQFCIQRHLRQSLNHHIIFLLLTTSFIFVTISLPLSQAYLYNSYVYPTSNIYCHFWNWIHYSLNITNLFLMGFVGFEQNWFIFYPGLFENLIGKILFHYCPILCCLAYPTTFYFILIFLYPCRQWYNFTQLLCRWPCYYRTIPFFSIFVYIRVLIRLRSLKLQVLRWRQNRQMILQLWAISSLYLEYISYVRSGFASLNNLAYGD